jgi:hypothetical protein
MVLMLSAGIRLADGASLRLTNAAGIRRQKPS